MEEGAEDDAVEPSQGMDAALKALEDEHSAKSSQQLQVRC
jgi:hypothetical protein